MIVVALHGVELIATRRSTASKAKRPSTTVATASAMPTMDRVARHGPPREVRQDHATGGPARRRAQALEQSGAIAAGGARGASPRPAASHCAQHRGQRVGQAASAAMASVVLMTCGGRRNTSAGRSEASA